MPRSILVCESDRMGPLSQLHTPGAPAMAGQFDRRCHVGRDPALTSLSLLLLPMVGVAASKRVQHFEQRFWEEPNR
jgi:hypothetical protein